MAKFPFHKIHKNKKGVASFYIVAFSTLILVVVATSFATVILSETTRTSNDDLSQSAYDSALAGVEDAKLAYSNYKRCLEQGATAKAPNNDNTVTCSEIVYWMQNPDCDMVGHILGRIPESQSGEVIISDTVSNVTSDMNQAYTCVTINTNLDDYRATLSSANNIRVIKAKFKNGIAAADVKAVRINWYANRSDVTFHYDNAVSLGSGNWRTAFQPAQLNKVSNPPVLELQMVQTARKFKLNDFDVTADGKTDRATMYFVPFNDGNGASKTNDYYVGLWNNSGNNMSAAQVAKTNDRTVNNKPYGVYCPSSSTNDFLCTVTIDLPEPFTSNACSGDDCKRSDDTFIFTVSLPYGQPETDIAMEFLCKDGSRCDEVTNEAAGVTYSYAQIDGAQIVVDSTGRANDLYRRVETRLETSDTSFPYPLYALQILDGDNGKAQKVTKDMTVTSEYNFPR